MYCRLLFTLATTFLLQQNNAHFTLLELEDYIIDVGIETTAWLAKGHDVNPIEKVWDRLYRSLLQHSNHPNDLDERTRIMECIKPDMEFSS